ncbi:nuclear transport factor 2 family protein [Saccharothrix deserti]|uniref:nuclear transport factor 2 family protein n=1 Tax=Saccharothrix deserti TaxID=2593674 RepID=UPI00131A9ECF|nr:nuclear transport factor 2 family protein [Saccharothrix deserti]
MSGHDVVERVLGALNAHDLNGLVACFADDYVNETPVHPRRGFVGSAQVRRNWSRIFAGVPDIRARVPRLAVDGRAVWTEWEMSGTRTDGAAFLMRGVVVFTVADDTIASARFFLEPVEELSGDVDAATHRLVDEGSARGGKDSS